MAKQGNYVTLPGGGVNWTKDISDSLSGLSDSYRKQADTKAERELAAAAEQEDKRRYELGISREDARISAEDARYKAGLALNANHYATSQRRLDDQEELDRLERKRVAAERAALKAFLSGTSDTKVRRAAYEGNEAYKNLYGKQLDVAQENMAHNIFVGDALDNRAGVPEYEALGVNRGLTNKMVPQQAKDYMEYIQKVSDSGEYLGEEAKVLLDRYNATKGRELPVLEKNLNAYIDSYTPVTKGEAATNLRREAARLGVNPEAALRELPVLTAGYDSKEDLSKSALAQQKIQQDQYDNEAELVYKAIKLAQDANKDKNGSTGGGSYIKPKNLDLREVETEINSLDPGRWDKGTMLDMYKAAVAKGVPGSIALQSLKENLNVDHNVLFGTTAAPTGGIKEFVSYAQTRRDTNGTDISKSSVSDFKDALRAKRATYTDPAEANKTAFASGFSAFSPSRINLPYSSGTSGRLPPPPAPTVATKVNDKGVVVNENGTSLPDPGEIPAFDPEVDATLRTDTTNQKPLPKNERLWKSFQEWSGMRPASDIDLGREILGAMNATGGLSQLGVGGVTLYNGAKSILGGQSKFFSTVVKENDVAQKLANAATKKAEAAYTKAASNPTSTRAQAKAEKLRKAAEEADKAAKKAQQELKDMLNPGAKGNPNSAADYGPTRADYLNNLARSNPNPRTAPRMNQNATQRTAQQRKDLERYLNSRSQLDPG